MAYHANTVSYSRTMAYHAKSIRGLGWTLVVLGTVSTILGTAAIAAMASREQATYLHYIAGPVWSGLFVLITGILGVLSGKKPTNRCLIVAFMVLGIFTILSTFCSFGLAVSGAIIDSCYVYSPWHRDFHHDYVDYIIPPDYGYNGTASNYTRPVPDIDYGDVSPLRVYSDDAGCTTAAKALHGVSALLALAELVLGFVVSIMCCCGLCNTGAPQVSGGQGGFILLQAVPSPHQFGAQPQVFLAPPGGRHAPLQVYYSAGQAPPQCGHTGGVAAAAAPQMYAQHPGAQSTEAPPMDTKTPLTA
ncbi:uncharacterized protein LOC118419480 isoform X2 [Branchiostoma floridae]|uniref:Uncharacterized protein LOC118419480 isoform X2 n=1 Tax=Branchiostoma floridae TaxID=7739 RepID=A0A9J7MWV9_BRAFL|nr:uncharacterized protein LOC118419480 isoform X2 [Branchiostoma floridae]